MEAEPHLQALTQHGEGGLAVPGVYAAIEVKVVVDSFSSITATCRRIW